tara:strand:- start:11 stop:205 length:195 start_codon:yes stop_codon:yes gene_type:complete
MRVYINKNKLTETVSTWSWGLHDSKGNPILISCKVFDTEQEAVDDIQGAFKDWGLQLDGGWNKT